MPIYEYQCLACQHQFDVMQDMNEKPPTTCPECKKRRLKKLVSATSFQLKGTGWYVTDFKNPSQKPCSTGADSNAGKDSKGEDTQTSSVESKTSIDNKDSKSTKENKVKSNKQEKSEKNKKVDSKAA